MTTATRPVTILAERHAQRWFPILYRHTDGSLLLYVQHGYDGNFSPVHRLRSIDQGKSWHEEQENTPRTAWAHSFSDGQLLEIDTYGAALKAEDDCWIYYASWSVPGSTRTAERRFMKVHAPSLGHYPLTGVHGYPSYPWWDLFNESVGKAEASKSEIGWRGAVFTGMCEVDGRLVAVAYGYHKEDIALVTNQGKHLYSVLCFESHDRGVSWQEIGMVARGTIDTSEGFNEASLTILPDGRFYSIIRGGDFLYHSWSQDGREWTPPVVMPTVGGEQPRRVWPFCIRTTGNALVAVYGRPGKKLIIDRTGTGTCWEPLFDLHEWELKTQEMNGVPPELRLRGNTDACIRFWDSSDYLGLADGGDGYLYLTYDVQNYLENWNSYPVSAVRLVRIAI
jgi:hypothetical protein